MHKIELLKTHTHANEVHFAGSVIEVDETTATWLIERGVGKSAITQREATQSPAEPRRPRRSDTNPDPRSTQSNPSTQPKE